MSTNDVCKCQIRDAIYRVREYLKDDGSRDHYAVLYGRRICKGGAWFTNEQSAILFMLRTAFSDAIQTSVDFYL